MACSRSWSRVLWWVLSGSLLKKAVVDIVKAILDGRLRPGKLVLMTGMGAGLTWGSALIRWTKEMAA